MDYPFCANPGYTPGDPAMYDLRWMVAQIQSLTTLVQGIARGQISIHALREEGDRLLRTINKNVHLFLSTPSARRATFTS